jgi:hypothetical protein
MKPGTRVIYYPSNGFAMKDFAGLKATTLQPEIISDDQVVLCFDVAMPTFRNMKQWLAYLVNVRELHDDCDQNAKLLAECPHCNGSAP